MQLLEVSGAVQPIYGSLGAKGLNKTYTLRKTGWTLVWGSHRLLHGMANVTLSVANDETGFKDLTLKHLLQCSRVNKQTIQ
jgi:hypothetical protein